MSTKQEYADWVNGLAGDYVENWVGDTVADVLVAKDKQIAQLEQQLAEYPLWEERLMQTEETNQGR